MTDSQSQQTVPASEASSVSDSTEEPKVPSPGPVNKWQFLSLAAVMLTLIVVVVVGFSLKGTTDSITGIIGAALPPFAAIAAAIFGIKAVFDSGKAAGHATGKEEGEENKDAAVRDAERKTAVAIATPLRKSSPDATSDLVGHLRRATASPHGSDALQLFGPDPTRVIELPAEMLDRAEQPSRDVQIALAIAERYIRE